MRFASSPEGFVTSQHQGGQSTSISKDRTVPSVTKIISEAIADNPELTFWDPDEKTKNFIPICTYTYPDLR